jgi:PAS domain S-box-containing protein
MGNDHSLAQKNGHTYWLVGAGAVLFILGGVFTWWTVLRADRQLREVLLQQTRLVALALNVEHVQALSGDAADLGNPNYQRLKEQFAAIKQSSDRCRFVYLLGRRLDGRVFFLVDNEPPNSKDYSPPGQVYEEASDAIHRVFVSEAESVAGPQEDRWGGWVTALVPLRDRQTGRLVAVLGMDVDARAWRQTVLLAAAWPVGSMLAALALLILSVFLARSRRKILSHQEALRAKTEELERYFSQSLDLLCLASTDGRFLRLNPEWERTLGYSIGELENRAFLDFVHPDDLAATREAVSRLSDQETILNFENRYRHQDGSYRWIEWRSIPQGNLIYAAARDVTERKRTEQELRESRERLELALEAANDGLWDWDIAQDKVFFDSRYYTLSGYEPNEFPQRFEEWSKRVHPDDLGGARKPSRLT